MIEAVIFDIDGTLHDWETSIQLALKDVMPEVPPALREGLPERLDEAIARCYFTERDGLVVDRRHWMFLVDPAPPWREALPQVEPQVVDEIARRFQSLLEAVPFADVPPTIDALSAEYSLATLSNNPGAEQIVARLGLGHYFEAVVVASEPAKKPHPDGFLRACQELGVSPAEAAYVGDSIANDVEGALVAGLIPIWLDRYGDVYPLPEGVLRVQSLEDLPDLLAALPGDGGSE